MKVLQASSLHPWQTVWVENNGFAFKKVSLKKAVVLSITPHSVLLFPFVRLPLDCYNRDLTWRCWDEKPDTDTLAEEEWAA